MTFAHTSNACSRLVVTFFCVWAAVFSTAASAQRTDFQYQDVSSLGVRIFSEDDANAVEPEAVEPTTEHVRPTILGEIIVQGKPVCGVRVTADNEASSCVTDEQGQFEVRVPYKWFGRITPVKEGWVFDPPFKEYRHVIEDVNDRVTDQELFEYDMSFNEVHTESLETRDPCVPSISPGSGRLGVTPMVISLESEPGSTLKTSVTLSHMGEQTPDVFLEMTELRQQLTGEWRPAAIDRTVVDAKPHSCRTWVTLERTSVTLSGMDVVTCDLDIQVPTDARGFYSAALVVCAQNTAQNSSPINCAMVIPVLIEVALEQAVTHISVTDMELVVPFSTEYTQQPRVRITVENQGTTLRRFKAFAAAGDTLKLDLDSAQEVIDFEPTWIMPGACVVLEADYVGPDLNQIVTMRSRIDLVEEAEFIRHFFSSQKNVHAKKTDVLPHTLATDPSKTLAMVDYNTQHAIHLEQCSQFGDPFRTYRGQCYLGLAVNFQASVQAMITSCSKAQGRWTATVCPSEIQSPSHVTLTVMGRDVSIDKLARQNNVSVAKLGVQIMPQIGRWR